MILDSKLFWSKLNFKLNFFSITYIGCKFNLNKKKFKVQCSILFFQNRSIKRKNVYNPLWMLECLFIKYDFHQDFKRMHLLCKVQLMYQCPKKKLLLYVVAQDFVLLNYILQKKDMLHNIFMCCILVYNLVWLDWWSMRINILLHMILIQISWSLIRFTQLLNH